MTKELSAFLEWSRECEREAVHTVHLMFPDDAVFALEAKKSVPCAALALDHLRALQAANNEAIPDAQFWVAYHLLQRTLVG
jgi:hypothetical protein